jgi:type IV fimbrial biogenesis protein FimT
MYPGTHAINDSISVHEICRFTMSSLKTDLRGFSLVELMVVLAVVGILIALAAPPLQSIILKNRVQAAAAEFQSGLTMARAEAIKRGGDARVTMVPNSNTGGTANWNSGFTVFYDTTADANGGAPPPSDAPTLLMKTSALSTGVSAEANVNFVIYNGLGRSINADGAFLAGHAAFGSSSSDWICTVIGPSGRVRVTTVANAAYNAAAAGAKCN